MEYVIRLDDAPADLAAIERQLLDLDPAPCSTATPRPARSAARPVRSRWN